MSKPNITITDFFFFSRSVVAFLYDGKESYQRSFAVVLKDQPVSVPCTDTMRRNVEVTPLFKNVNKPEFRCAPRPGLPRYVLIYTLDLMRDRAPGRFRDNLGCSGHQYIQGNYGPSGRTVLELRIGDAPVTGTVLTRRSADLH